MRNKNKRLAAAKVLWVLDALTVVILGVRLGGETFYVYGHPEQTELAEHYWITAGEIVLEYLPVMIGLTLGGLVLTALAARTQKRQALPEEDGDDQDGGDPLLAAIDEYEAEDIAIASAKDEQEKDTAR